MPGHKQCVWRCEVTAYIRAMMQGSTRCVSSFQIRFVLCGPKQRHDAVTHYNGAQGPQKAGKSYYVFGRESLDASEGVSLCLTSFFAVWRGSSSQWQSDPVKRRQKLRDAAPAPRVMIYELEEVEWCG